jgi:hypothetical protein
LELGRQISVSLNVYLGEGYSIFEFLCKFLHDWCEHMAWCTPGRPKVDNHWAGASQDLRYVSDCCLADLCWQLSILKEMLRFTLRLIEFLTVLDNCLC